MRFCTVCEGRLDYATTATELFYQCTRCNKKYHPTAEDTLRVSQVFNNKESVVQHDTFLRGAAFDVVNPREYKQCPSCKKEIVSYVVVGNDMKYVYVCTCGNRF